MARHSEYFGEPTRELEPKERTPLQSSLYESFLTMNGLYLEAGMDSYNNATGRAVSNGIIRRLSGESGLSENECSLGFIHTPSIPPSFRIQYGEDNLSYEHGRDRVSCNSGTPYRCQSLLNIAPEKEDSTVRRIAEAFDAARLLIEKARKRKETLIADSLAGKKQEDMEAAGQQILNLSDAISGLGIFINKPEFRATYLSGGDENEAAMQNNFSGYDCRPSNALATIQTALTGLNALNIKIGRRLIVPLREIVDYLEQDAKSKEPVTFTGRYILQRLREVLSGHGIDILGNNTVTLQKVEEMKAILRGVTNLIAIVSDREIKEPTTDSYLNALLEAYEPEWEQETKQ